MRGEKKLFMHRARVAKDAELGVKIENIVAFALDASISWLEIAILSQS